jgi:hypothetical protein
MLRVDVGTGSGKPVGLVYNQGCEMYWLTDWLCPLGYGGSFGFVFHLSPAVSPFFWTK